MGMFDDLVPDTPPAKTGGRFDDLIPDTAPVEADIDDSMFQALTPSEPEATAASVARQLVQGSSLPIAGATIGSPFGPLGTVLGATALPLADAIGQAYNFAADQAGFPEYKLRGSTSQYIKGLLTDAGIFEPPRNQPERIASVVGEATGLAGGQIKGGQKLAEMSGPVIQRIGRALSEAPKTQLAVAPTSAAAGQFTAEETGDPLLGLGASILTGLTVAGLPKGNFRNVNSETLKNQANAAYKAADEAGVVVKAESVDNIQASMRSRIDAEGYDADLHPGLSVVLKRLGGNENPLTLSEIDRFRRVLLNVVRNKDPNNFDQQRIAGEALQVLDDGISRLARSDLVSGNAQGIRSLTKARDLWKRKSKTEVIEDVLDRARLQAENYSQSGMENALRQQFKTLAQNKRKMRQFSERERQLIRKAASGGPLINTMRFIGKFAPRGVVSFGVGAGTGAATMGPAGAIAVPTIGMVGQQVATQMRKSRANDALRAAAGDRIPSRGATVAPATLRSILSNPDYGLLSP